MRKIITTEEWYPVHCLHDPSESETDKTKEVPDELVERFQKAYDEFQAVQDLLEEV